MKINNEEDTIHIYICVPHATNFLYNKYIYTQKQASKMKMHTHKKEKKNQKKKKKFYENKKIKNTKKEEVRNEQ